MRSRSMNTLTILVTLCQCFVHLSAEKHLALVIHRFKGSLYEIPPDENPETECGSWASACPAKDEADQKFISDTAITENAMFVQKICEKEKSVGEAEFKTDICESQFQISVLLNKTNLAFEFGYEIYYRKDDKSLFHTHYRLKYYTNPKRIFGSINEKSKLTKVVFKEAIKLLLMENKNHWHNENRKLRFMWASLFKIEFDFFNWTPKKIVYQIRKNNKWPVAFSCEKYDLVTEAYEGVDLDLLYSADNQGKIFSNLELPQETSAAACRPNCLEKWLLIPIDQFHFGTLDYTLCSNMATVPIWSSTIRKVMMKLEKFLYALYQASSTGLHISSGISGKLQLTKKKKKWWMLESSKKIVYLDPEHKKIPVPKILYKVVKYKPKKCPKGQVCVYSATIVIHNDPNFNPTTDKICKDITEAWAWTEATVETVPDSEETPDPSPYIYVCKTDWKLLVNLMGVSAIGEPFKMGDLKLNEFPFYDARRGFVTVPMSNRVRYPLIELDKREKELRRTLGIDGHEVARRFIQSLLGEMEESPPRLIPMDGIVEDEEEENSEGIETEDTAQNNIIERSQGDLEADAVVFSPLVDELNKEIQNESIDNDDEDGDTSGDEVQKSLARAAAARERLLHLIPDSKSDEESVTEDEGDDDEVSDSEIQGQSSHKEDSNAKMGSEDDGTSSSKKDIKAGTVSSNLEEESSPRKSQSLDGEEVNSTLDLKHEEKCSPEDGTKATASSNVQEQSSPKKEE